MKERVLITGASGFLGFHIIEEALKNNLEVYAAIRQSSQIEHLKHFDITYTYPDFTDIPSLKKELVGNNYDYIIHAAGVTKAVSQKQYNHINGEYTQNLAKAIVESGIKLKKMVLISSLAAIGPLSHLNGILTESSSPNPLTYYGKSKLLAEENLKSFTNLNYTILRPTGVYGPRDRDIFIFFKQIVKRIEPYIGNMQQTFSFIYVKDLARATILALKSTRQATYNLSDGNSYNRYELGNLIKEALKIKTIKFHLPVFFVNVVAIIAEKYCSLNDRASVLNREKLKELMAVNWYCSIDEAKTGLGFIPEYDLRAGVKETLKWYKVNKWL